MTEEIPTIGVTARTVDGLAERSWIVELEGQKVNDISRADQSNRRVEVADRLAVCVSCVSFNA